MSGVESRNCPLGQRGMVLVIVLWIVTLLAVMAGGFAYSMRVETRLATSAVERAQARALAEAGVAYGLAWQLDLEAQKQWPPNGDPREWAFGGGRLRIEVTNASGLVNLNNAGSELLKALLAGADVARGSGTSWRTPFRTGAIPTINGCPMARKAPTIAPRAGPSPRMPILKASRSWGRFWA